MNKPFLPLEEQSRILNFLEDEFRSFAKFSSVVAEGAAMVESETQRSTVDVEELIAICGLFAILSELIGSFRILIENSRLYAAACLSRQIVEIEYLVWSFANQKREARIWLTATRESRLQVFRPKSIRNISNGLFPDSDYSMHCELGGHPSPSGFSLLANSDELRYSFVCDVIGHSRATLSHLAAWSDLRPIMREPIRLEHKKLELVLFQIFEKFAIRLSDRAESP